MRVLVLLAAMIMVPADSVFAAETDYTEFDVIAVIPRSPDVQPYFLSVPAKGQPKAAVHPRLADAGKARNSTKAPPEIQQRKVSAKEVKSSVQRLTEGEE